MIINYNMKSFISSQSGWTALICNEFEQLKGEKVISAGHLTALSKVKQRFEYLDDVLESDEEQLYEPTKRLFISIFKLAEMEIMPLIGVADSGQVVAEWKNIGSYSGFIILPKSEDEIIIDFLCIHDDEPVRMHLKIGDIKGHAIFNAFR